MHRAGKGWGSAESSIPKGTGPLASPLDTCERSRTGRDYSQQAMSSTLQWTEGTHRLEEPVSNTTVKH
jgi:hypothetical protein